MSNLNYSNEGKGNPATWGGEDVIRIYVRDKLSHPRVISQATKAVMRHFRLMRSISDKNTQNNPLKELIGIEKSLTGTVGLQVDDLYLQL